MWGLVASRKEKQMFNLRMAVVLGLSLAVISTVARAAQPIEFEFTGVFTQTTGTVHQVGQPFTTTVLFDPTTPDLDPSPSAGNYPFISWTVPNHTSTPSVFGDPGTIQTAVGGAAGADVWSARYLGASQFRWELNVFFPIGTLPTDALPQTLNLSQATGTSFEAFNASVGMDLRGTINSLTVRIVPEPALMATFCWLFAVRRSRARHKA
jgi:hypothetical protein